MGLAEPSWSEAEHALFEAELLRLAERFAQARAEDGFEGMPEDTCHRLGCGFVRACHGERGQR